MASNDPTDGPSFLDQWLPYGLVAVGLMVGLVVLLFEPLPGAALNTFVGWSVLAIGFGSIYFLVARGGGPGGRGPDF